MGKRTIVLVVALILAAVSAFSVWRYLSTIEAEVRRDIDEVRVYVATQDIETGTTGEEARPFIVESVALLEAVDPDVNGSVDILCLGENAREGEDPDPTICQNNASDLDLVLNNNVAAGPITRGQMITTSMFVELAALNSAKLSDSIAQGRVAISVRPSDDSASGGFVRPGDRVNLLASASINLSGAISLLEDPNLRAIILGTVGQGAGGGGQTPGLEGEEPSDPTADFAATLPATVQFTQTVLQNVEVLAVGADTREQSLGLGLEPTGSEIVVLEVTPEQAEAIEFAKQFTSVTLSLLPDPEVFPYTEFEARGVLIEDLFDLLPRIQELFEPLEGLLGN
jgi:Flp pilus assembly protein CpaB